MTGEEAVMYVSAFSEQASDRTLSDDPKNASRAGKSAFQSQAST